jgi:DNA-binding response OmpR family regulator
MSPYPPRPRVLLVEDETTICDFLCESLSKDYEVVCVSRVDEALLVFARQHIDVVLLDHYLVDGNARVIAQRADRAEVPVVWMPGDPEAIDTLVRTSDFMMAKPFGVQQMLNTLAKARRCQ